MSVTWSLLTAQKASKEDRILTKQKQTSAARKFLHIAHSRLALPEARHVVTEQTETRPAAGALDKADRSLRSLLTDSRKKLH